MDYTPAEREVLSLIQRTDFKNLSKNDLMSYASKLSQLRPEVARDVVAQFPELANMIKAALTEYRGMLTEITESDDASLNQVYQILNQEIEVAADSRKEYYSLAAKVQSDLSKCLDNPNLSAEERESILDREIEILQLADKKDTEIRQQEKEAVSSAKEKDTEKRKFNWNLIGAASAVIVVALGVGAAALGGDFKFKLPGQS